METTTNTQTGTATENEQNRKVLSKQKQNKMMFIEYESALPNGHFITVSDRFKNVLGRIHRNYNAEKGKYIYSAFDNEGKQLFQPTEKLYELKQQFLQQKLVMMEKAHQRRKEMKGRWKDQSLKKEPMSIAPIKFRRKSKKEEKVQEQKPLQNQPEQKTDNKQVEKNTEEKRIEELQELREEKGQNQEHEISR